MRIILNYPASRQDIGCFEVLSVLTKFVQAQISCSHLFSRLLLINMTKCIARAKQTNRWATASLLQCIVGQLVCLKNRIRTCVLQQPFTLR